VSVVVFLEVFLARGLYPTLGLPEFIFFLLFVGRKPPSRVMWIPASSILNFQIYYYYQ